MKFSFKSNPENPTTDSRLVYSFEDPQDSQGINFGTPEMPWPRNQFRLNRFETYSSYKNLNKNLELCQVTISDKCQFFEFKKNNPIPCEYSHFQLRNNIKVKSSELIYLKSKVNTISMYNPVTNQLERIITPNFPAVSFDVLDEYIVIGGMEGELMFLDSNSVLFSKVLSQQDSKITNSVKIFQEDSYTRLLVCNNDHHIRIIDPQTQNDLQVFKMDACVNDASLSADKNLIAACLDLEFDFILDRRTGEVVAKCEGHSDYGFSVDWDPSNQFELATGNQDQSVMIWDMRKSSEPLYVFYCYMGAGLKVEYSKNGKYLAFAESADFLTIIDKKNLKERQFLDFFGEISGFGFDESDPENLRIFLGMADPTYYSLIELHENSQTKFMI